MQGSVAMSTVVRNENKDYAIVIDVAVVFEKSALGDKGAQATRNMVADALSRKTKQINAEPLVKTSCVRVRHAEAQASELYTVNSPGIGTSTGKEPSAVYIV